MVAAQPANDHETIFTVLGDAARRRTPGGLAMQLAMTLAVAVTVLLVAPEWWSFAVLLVAPAAHAAWGLVMHRHGGLGPHHELIPVVIAATGATAALVGTISLALAMFSGTAKGTYSACGVGATSPMCRAWTNPPPASGTTIR